MDKATAKEIVTRLHETFTKASTMVTTDWAIAAKANDVVIMFGSVPEIKEALGMVIADFVLSTVADSKPPNDSESLYDTKPRYVTTHDMHPILGKGNEHTPAYPEGYNGKNWRLISSLVTVAPAYPGDLVCVYVWERLLLCPTP